MSSLWSSMKKRKSSLSSPNLRERESCGDSKPGSERLQSSREEAFSDRVTRLAEQVLPRSGFRSLRLPPLLTKGFATGSLPRHFSTRSVEVQSATGSADSKFTRTPLMGSSPDRFQSPLKNILMRPRRGKPPIPPEKIPLKPCRRPGPVGKSWIKVYDDIIYIDEPSSDDIGPFLGYTGHPTMVPGADPLPMAPTPPPEKLRMELIKKTPPRPKRASGRSPRSRSAPSEDKENLSPNATGLPKPPPPSGRVGRSREISRYKAKRQKRAGTPLNRDVTTTIPVGNEEDQLPAGDDKEEVMEDGYIIPQSLKPPKPPRGNKIYETVKQTLQQPDKDQEPQVDTYLNTTPQPEKPKRGVKIYESIVIKVKDEGSGSVEEKSRSVTQTSSPLTRSQEGDNKVSSDVPCKPKRGIKIYETIEIGFRVSSSEGKPTSTIVNEGKEVKQEEGKVSFSVAPMGDEVKQDSPGKDTLETSPTRGNESEDKCPSKPLRRNKIYSTVNLSHPLKSTSTIEGPTASHFSGNVKETEEVIGESKIDTSETCVDTPVYAKIHRNSQVKDLNEESGLLLREIPDPSSPPPVPPKKRKQLRPPECPDENVYDFLPSRPSRRLKLQSRSYEASPLRPKRYIPLTPPKAHRSCNRWTQNVNEEKILFKDGSATLPLPRSKTKMIESSSCEDLNDIQKPNFPSKPFRNMHSRFLPAPPRRKKLDKSFEDDQTPLPLQDDSLPIPKSLEHFPISKVNRDFVVLDSRSLETTLTTDTKVAEDPTPPPPPPKKERIAATRISKTNDSLPSNLFRENGRTVTTESSESESPLNKITEFSSSLETRAIGCDAEDFSSARVDADIENNLKTIESSFETLDTVIQCLKKYTPQSALNETDKTVIPDKDQINRTIEPADCGYLLTTTDLLPTPLKQELRAKESTSGVTESEICDLSVANSDAETVIFVGKSKSSSQESLNLIDNNPSSSDLEEKKDISPSLLVEEGPENLGEDNDGAEPKPIEISFVIIRDQPVTLPQTEEFISKTKDRRTDSNAPTLITEIPLTIKDTQKTEFKFEPPKKGDIETKLTPVPTETPSIASFTENTKAITSLTTLAEPITAFSDYFLPFNPVSLEGRATLNEVRKCLLENEVRKISPETFSSGFQLPSYPTTPTNLLYFHPSSLRSEKPESDLPEHFYPSSPKPCAYAVDHRSEVYSTSNNQSVETFTLPNETKLEIIRPSMSAGEVAHKHSSGPKPKDTLSPRKAENVGSSLPFNSLSPIHLTAFFPKLLEGRKDPSERQQKYRLEPKPDKTPFLNLEYLERLKTIPFYDLPPTDILPFFPTSLVSEEQLEDSLTAKASSPEPEDSHLTPLSQVAAFHSGTFELASRLEGIHSQLEAIITNYPTSCSSSHTSLDTALSDLSNRSSLCLDFPPDACDSTLSIPSSYSSTPELDYHNYSSCSTPLTFYTAATPSERSIISDSGTNTPGSSSNSSLIAEDYNEYTIEHDVGDTSPLEEEAEPTEF